MKPKNRKKQLLYSRLTGYAAAAGALAALTSNANGQVIYSGPQNREITYPDQYLEIDMDSDGVFDFGFQLSEDFYYSSAGPGFFWQDMKLGAIQNLKTESYQNSWITKMSTVRSVLLNDVGTIIKYGTELVDGLEPGELVDTVRNSWSNVTQSSGPGILGLIYSYLNSTMFGNLYQTSFNAGEFIDQEKFIGVRFYIGSEQHYGWIRVSLGDELDPLTIVDWAYESTPEEGIVAGDGLGVDMPPNLYITGGDLRTNDSTVTLDIHASKEITGFVANDINIQNGISENFAEITPGWEYSIDVTASQEGKVIVEIPDSVVLDLANHPNSRSNISWYLDITGPVSEFLNFPALTNDQYTDINIKFKEKAIGLSEPDFNVTNGSIQNLYTEKEGFMYRIRIVDSDDGEVIVELLPSMITDLAGNPNISDSISWIYDETGPVITLDAGIVSTADTVNEVDILFNEPAYGLDPLDFDIAQGWITTIDTITPDLHYILTVVAYDSAHVTRTLVVKLFPGCIHDYAGNQNESIVSTSWIYQPVGLETSSDNGILIYPNPVRDNLRIKLAGEATIKIIDLSGNIIYMNENALDELIDVSRYNPGVYIIQVQNSEKVTQYKIVIE